MSAVETAREFCRAWFEKLDLDEVIAFLAEDITFVGTGEDEFVRGKPGMAAREAGYF
ncbi:MULTISPECIES: nuclear transport factor 2 family protein [Intestinimonas]|nr:nuclear transport factor 2 family protein [Intestinimonas butyriciproducens]MDB7815989.1 nuclear transport factor 2 family protein [Intestinimonas butyriciproducens]MDB7843241.1 nuclear transport factor 2 family protein [Intestinimonas butyriciproducens]MDB7857011.1 nuclear transport factor 2 family protein [Intestinimonas butyriciproducens]